MDKYFLYFLVSISFLSCQQVSNDLESILQTDPYLDSLLQQPEHRIQVIYTQIDRDEDGTPNFFTQSFQLDTTRYYYPASTVKLPAALLALEKINQLNIPGLDRNSTLITGAESPPQTSVLQDSSKADLLPSIAHYIKKILLVSDNDAYNRLYEFLGQSYINDKLQEKGYTRSRIIHRLSVSGFDTLANRKTNPVSFYNGDQLLYQQDEVYSNGYPTWTLSDQIQGKAYMDGEGAIIPEAFDFRYKNYMSLLDLHDILQAALFPEAITTHKGFDLSPDDYAFLREYMSKLPRQSEDPAYPDLESWDDYVKFLLFGSEKNRIPDHIKIYNKVGDAYGYLTDIAYIVDEKHGVEFLLAATIHVNRNETFNDGVYEYDSIGFPFLKRLGEVIHQYEISNRSTLQ